MNDEMSFSESLTENIEDWFYTNCHRSCYDTVDDYIDDIRCMIANNNDDMIDTCLRDLVEVYYMNNIDVNNHIDDVTNILISEAQNALDNFSYRKSDKR